MGAKKWTFEKRGAAHRFFFFETPMMFFFISWAPRPSAPIVFFFLKRPLIPKKNHGQVTHKFLFIFPLITKKYMPIWLLEYFFFHKIQIFGEAPMCAHCFFFILPPINFKKKSWAVRPSAPMRFFFPAHDPGIPNHN